MKKIINSMAVAFMVIGAANAQSAQVKIVASEAEIPAIVVESFKKDFGAGQTDEWAIVPVAIVGEEYIVSEYDDLNGEIPNSYSVKIKGTNMKGEAIYDQNGKLKYSKQVTTNTALPVAVRDAVTKKYPNFTLLKDQETIREGKTNFIHYRIIIEKGKEKKALAVDASGKILKERKVRL